METQIKGETMELNFSWSGISDPNSEWPDVDKGWC